MELPVLKAIAFKQIMSSGSTRPWLVEVEVEGIPTPYVVKLYQTPTVEAHAVTKEVICWVLAQEFDLEVPDAALVTFNKYFLDALSKELKKELSAKDTRIKFGSKLIKGATEFSIELMLGKLTEYDIATIFAFDVLIENVDRRFSKTGNLLFKKDEYFLIDHELSFSDPQVMLKRLQEGNSITKFAKEHMFYPVLKRKVNKASLFQTFEEYLKVINVNKLNSYAKQLVTHGHPTENVEFIKEYLIFVTKNSSTFIQLLKSIIA